MIQDSVANLIDLSGRAAVVTGAGRGIGAAIAKLLAAAGAAVLVTDVNEVDVQNVAMEIGQSGARAVGLVSDVSKDDEAARVIDACVRNFGRIDVLVNNAAVFRPDKAINVTPADWNLQHDVNLKAVFFHAQAAARWMIENKHSGRIVNIASLNAFHPAGSVAIYDSTKGGVVSLTRSLAREWGEHNIFVNAIAPGSIETPGSEAARERMLLLVPERASLKKAPRSVFGRNGSSADVANAVLYLASDIASYVTGETLVVDGGYWLL